MTKKTRAQLAAERQARLDAAARGENPYRWDRRAETSRANLGNHVPIALGYGDSQVLTVRLPAAVMAELEAEAARSGLTRSDIVRWCIEHALPESRKIEPYEPW